MKNLKTGNYTEFRDISDGFHLRCGELNMTNLGYAKVSKNEEFGARLNHKNHNKSALSACYFL